MAQMASPLEIAIGKYAQALNAVDTVKQDHDLSSKISQFVSVLQNTQPDPQSTAAMANIGFFFASRIFDKVLVKIKTLKKSRI